MPSPHPTEKPRELSWSCSREDIFTRCQLEYFFNYYGAYGGYAANAPAWRRELFILKNTKNRHAWMGDLVHNIIEEFLSHLHVGKRLSREELLIRADKRMRKEFIESRDELYRQNPGRCNGLVEHENKILVPEEKWKALHENVMNCVANFFYTDFYWNHVEGNSRSIVKTEKLDHYDLDGIKVYAKPDVAVSEDGFLSIIDWKTGAQADEHEFQIYYYALYAIQKLKKVPEEIRPSIVYLRDNTVKPVELSITLLENSKTHLKNTFEEMKSFHEPFAHLEDYSSLKRASSLSTCGLCRFKKLCHPKSG